MTQGKAKSAREIAAMVLSQMEPAADYATGLLNRMLSQTDQPQRATDLTFGTIRNRQAIDLVISDISGRPVERIQRKMINIIRVAVYELVYSPQTADYAIVNSAVENCRLIAGKKQVGFVNAVLRQITRQIKSRLQLLSQSSVQATLPQDISYGCQFDSDILPDPHESPGLYLSSAFSLPLWLIEKWLKEFGFQTTQNICFASNRRPSVYLRPNSLKTTLPQLADLLSQAQIEFEILSDVSMVSLKSPKGPDRLPGFSDGLFSVQDPTAASVVRVIDAQPDWDILDLCAAPGTKTTQLAEVTFDKSRITATDISNQRLKRLTENIERLNLTSIKVVDFETVGKSSQLFDCILIDAPCSNSGVLAKRPEVRYRVTPTSIRDLTKIQFELLDKAKDKLKPHGKIVYSTCSIESEENRLLISDFLHQNPDFQLQHEVLTLPNCEMPDKDGGYVAIMTRKN